MSISTPDDRQSGAPGRGRRPEIAALAVVLAAAILLWIPRTHGPIDLRWDAAVYYILGTSLAEGRGYKLLNEPGEIDAVQYPPLLPAIVAAHQAALGTSDPTPVGRWLRLTSFVVFVAFAAACFSFFRAYVSRAAAVLGAMLSVLCLHAWFLSDMLFPEVPFTLATLLFLIFAGRPGGASAVAAYVSAVAAYALRTVGLAALAAWVLESVLRRQYPQALLRAVLAAIPLMLWHGYVASVERSDGYQRPAYAYQRAPYLFYNVSYARNIALRDPFTPEKGEVRVFRRIARNALELPVYLGETLSVSRGYLEMALHSILGDGPVVRPFIAWSVYSSLAALGVLLAGGGLVVQWVQGFRLVPLYVLLYLAALALTPFPGQYLRYLMPLTPPLALLALVFLIALSRRSTDPSPVAPTGRLPWIVLGTAAASQLVLAGWVYANEYQPVTYEDRSGRRLSYRLFYYDDRQEGFERAIDYIRSHAAPDDIVAAGTPHWIHLRTGLKTVMPPFEADPPRAQTLLDTVPVATSRRWCSVSPRRGNTSTVLP
jgi:hypothetical protein